MKSEFLRLGIGCCWERSCGRTRVERGARRRRSCSPRSSAARSPPGVRYGTVNRWSRSRRLAGLGAIKELLVDFNSEVKKGQVIARIDPEAFNLRVTQAMADVEATRATVLSQRANVAALQAEVSRAKFSLGDAERELQRNKGLYAKNFVSAAALDKAQAAFDGAREQVKSAQANLAAGEAHVGNVQALVKQRESQLAQAKVDLERTTIRAPVDGTVVKKSVEPGRPWRQPASP